MPYNTPGLTGNERAILSLFDSPMMHAAGKRWCASTQGGGCFLIPVKKNWQKAEFCRELEMIENINDDSSMTNCLWGLDIVTFC